MQFGKIFVATGRLHVCIVHYYRNGFEIKTYSMHTQKMEIDE